MKQRPLILVTNDDGINSQGLWAAAEALAPLGELIVVAPEHQWSGAGRSMPHMVSGQINPIERRVNGSTVQAYAIDGAPAQVVIHAMLQLVPRRPALVVSGINSGENISTEITVSGTVGAALEAATFGVPAIAVSLEMAIDYHHHLEGKNNLDYHATSTYIHYFAQRILDHNLPYDVDVLNINVPADATPQTPWRLTRISRKRYFEPLPPDLENGEKRLGYKILDDPREAEHDSDVWAVGVERCVSVTPLSLDMTSRVDFGTLEEQFYIS